MPRLAVLVVLSLLAGLALCLRAKGPSQPPVELVVARAGSSASRLYVLLCNRGPNSLAVRRQLGDVEYDPHNPLQAHVFDRHTAQRVSNRYERKHASRRLVEGDFMVLGPGHCYGPSVDLEQHFLVEPGETYRVYFTYEYAGPAKVGKLKPWIGKLRSQEVTVVLPRASGR